MTPDMWHFAFVQRQAAGAKVCFYCDDAVSDDSRPEKCDVKLSVSRATDQRVEEVVLTGSSGRSSEFEMRAAIFIHKGKLFSIEHPKRLERYFEQHKISKPDLRAKAVNRIKTFSRDEA